MTTIVGIKTRAGIILGADTLHQDVIINEKGKYEKTGNYSHSTKLYSNKEKTAVLSYAGTINKKGKEILKDFSESRINLPEKISKRFFQEVLTLNYEMWGGRCPNNNFIHYLLATRFDKPRLYICWELGLIEETNFYSFGSGSQFAWEFIQNKIVSFKEKGFSLDEGLKLVSGALIYSASKDSGTEGLEMKVISPDKIQKVFLKK
ncbi:MAG TPA: hypothetical protein HA283_03195 [Nanoarchaeota archaeon]|nr:hypothetical protein [Nanoarchaeota archaeon]HIH63280.1 hypothetical protein [Nanoarchaeota archaeon]HIJ09276.1 hypothetical protein [Nanoarchaeota archaeon]